MGKKKIIILYSTGGMGHKKAAFALFQAFRKHSDKLDIEITDVLEYGSKLYRFIYLKLYVFLMSFGKRIWGALYALSNNSKIDALTRELRTWIDSISLPGLERTLAEKAPDAIVATHFLLPSIAGFLKKRRGCKAELFTLITDYGPHSYWLSDDMDMFFVGAESAAEEMLKRGIPASKIAVTGIPTSDEFSGEVNSDEIRAKYGLDADRKTIFLMSGGFGVGPLEKILFSMNSCTVAVQMIVVCGYNRKVYGNIRALVSRLDYPVILFGFTDKVAELMRVSDIMITKAGGISVTEALNAYLPMILFDSIPGQETWNEVFLLENKAARKAEKVDDIPRIINEMFVSPGAYDNVKKAIGEIRRPSAADRIADIVMERIAAG
ncbi:MAG: glycosyltransferase [Candidatus Omnitrophota bacterium]